MTLCSPFRMACGGGNFLNGSRMKVKSYEAFARRKSMLVRRLRELLKRAESMRFGLRVSIEILVERGNA